ncbi:ADP-ribose pyrophosphatase [Jatrophihabitans endophyticus]|uniref:ADP-ribose pyrophosphatase n=1 Tax=Jatrophihabitans endophyticus TaxID=1206085 RepID=A0A1M5CTR1_9ACTN|nr:NUDIX hydrolase [Jatrophihabitans endophyticus]SHF58131.1 ADP-ribose pyrophosphatase [Jatrophihabitans endophyticus]
MAYEVRSSQTRYDGAIIRVRTDEVVQPDGETATREVVEHADSVAIVALDDRERVLLIEQYRHPLAAHLCEIPAGLRDEEGEDPLDTARRELAEETGVSAGSWRTLVDVRTSPGILDETCRIYLARDLTEGDRTGAATGEEAELEARWTPLAEAVAMVFDGRITDALAVSGLLAAARVTAGQNADRDADMAWPG